MSRPDVGCDVKMMYERDVSGGVEDVLAWDASSPSSEASEKLPMILISSPKVHNETMSNELGEIADRCEHLRRTNHPEGPRVGSRKSFLR